MSHNITVNYSVDNFIAYNLDQENTAKPYHGLIVEVCYVETHSKVQTSYA